MKRTLKRESKVLEIVGREAFGGSCALWVYPARLGWTSPQSVGHGALGSRQTLRMPALRGSVAQGCPTARLETRTKESNMYASQWAETPRAQ